MAKKKATRKTKKSSKATAVCLIPNTSTVQHYYAATEIESESIRLQLAYAPVLPGTICFKVDKTIIRDDGHGTVYVDSGEIGLVDYETGTIELDSRKYNVDYSYDPNPNKTKLLSKLKNFDEDQIKRLIDIMRENDI